MDCDDEDAVLVGDGPEPPYEPLDRVRIMPNGRSYRIPELAGLRSEGAFYF